MRPIDADALIDELSLVYDIAESKDDPYNIGVMAAIVTVKKLPTIDAVPVVRCKDCKHWDKTWTNDWSPDYHYCNMIEGVRNGYFYCADAERSENA